jgi:hypothetical protein
VPVINLGLKRSIKDVAILGKVLFESRFRNVRKSGLPGIYPRQNSVAPRRKSFAFLRARPVNLSMKKAQNENLLQDPDAHSSHFVFTFNSKLSGFRPIRRQLDRTTYTSNGREKT